MAAPKKRREAERELKKKGFTLQPKRGKGSHEVWKDKSGNSLTVPKHGDEIAAGTWRSIDRQAAEAQKRAQAEEAQRLANKGVPRAGSGQGRSGSGQQGQQSQQSGKKQGKSRWSRGGRS